MPDLLMRGRRSLVDPSARFAEPFRTLRLALQLRTETRQGNVVIFTSAEPGAGKSTIAANYALVASLSHSTVLLIDADLRKPSAHEIFGLARSPGLVELLASNASLDHLVQRVSAVGQLDVLSAGRPIPGSTDLTSSQRMASVLAEASRTRNLVVIDAPPLLAGADAEGLASHAGADVVLVVRSTTKRRELRKALRRLELIEANVVGIVLNRHGRFNAYGY